ncbi:MAG: hypothetical protein Q9218_008114 [Villophora microphyllina]
MYSEIEFMDLDIELDFLRNQPTDMMTPIKAGLPFRNLIFPPTPEATPEKISETSSCSDSPALGKKPSRGLRPTRGVHPRRGAMSSYGRKIQEYKATKANVNSSLLSKHNVATAESASPSENDSTMAHHGSLDSRPLRSSNYRIGKSKCKAPMVDNKLLITSFELIRVHESLMKQMDWKVVAKNVAANRPASVYKRAVDRVFDAWMEELDELEDL